MFWFDSDFVEEEWSLSAKLFAGLVFNPFSVVNTGHSSLFRWFYKQVTGDKLADSAGWRAKPEYMGLLGRNDWRLHIGKWQIAVECKFGDGIDIYGDCLKYLEGMEPDCRRVLVVASVSEFSELTTFCMDETEQVLRLKKNLRGKTVIFLGWHEIVEAAVSRLPTEGAKEILKNWAYKVNRKSLLLMPKDPITGDQAAALILQGKIASIPITHRFDARGDRRPTANIEEVCNKRKAPDWVWNFMAEAQRACSKSNLVFESKRAGWVNVRRTSKSRSVTLFPWENGVAILISHPINVHQFPSYSSLELIGLQGIVPDKEDWFPRDRTIGIVFRSPMEHDKQRFVEEIGRAHV